MGEAATAMSDEPQNDKMQTRHGENGASLLILVLGRTRGHYVTFRYG